MNKYGQNGYIYIYSFARIIQIILYIATVVWSHTSCYGCAAFDWPVFRVQDDPSISLYRKWNLLNRVYICINGNTQNDLKKQKKFPLNRKTFAAQQNSFLRSRGNVYPINFLLQMFIFIILLLISIGVKSSQLMLLLLGTDVKTCLDVMSYFILL